MTKYFAAAILMLGLYSPANASALCTQLAHATSVLVDAAGSGLPEYRARHIVRAEDGPEAITTVMLAVVTVVYAHDYPVLHKQDIVQRVFALCRRKTR